jgi:NRPS condensation-like uncharacterized protein
MMSLHHAAVDGISALRILQSTARAYAAVADPLPEVDPPSVRDPAAWGQDSGIQATIRRTGGVIGELRHVLSRSTRLAAEGDPQPGYGFVHLALAADQTRWLIGSSRSSAATVNDLLLAALHLAIDEWKEAQGIPAGRIGIMMPVNLRPKQWWYEVAGNYSFMVPVGTRPQDRTGACRTITAVARRTRQVKDGDRAAAMAAAIRRLQDFPARAKLALAALANSDLLAPTALLSNLGVIDEPIRFGAEAGDVTHLWFSPPAKMPYGLAIGTVTYCSRLHISLRYRHPLFSADAARSFRRYLRRGPEGVERRRARLRGRHQAQAGSYAGMESQTWGAQCAVSEDAFRGGRSRQHSPA